MHFSNNETLSEAAARVCVALLFLSGSGYLISLGYGARRAATLFLTGTFTMAMLSILLWTARQAGL